MPASVGMIQSLKNLITSPGQTIYRSIAPKKTMAIARGLYTHPGETLSKGLKSTSLMDKLMIGGSVAPDLLALGKPTQPGDTGKAEHAGRALGTLAGGIAFNRAPMLGSMIGWTAGSMAGSGAGKLVGKATGIGKAKPMAKPGEEPSLHDKLFNKAGAAKKLKAFARKKIRDAKFKEIEPNKMGDIATATWRDPSGTFERVSATENKPHA